MSRDDSGSFLPHYAELEIVTKNPFATIDRLGRSARGLAVTRGRRLGPTSSWDLRRARRRSRSIHFFEKVEAGLRELLAVPRSRSPGWPRAGSTGGGV
jgi:hypothetical protein